MKSYNMGPTKHKVMNRYNLFLCQCIPWGVSEIKPSFFLTYYFWTFVLLNCIKHKIKIIWHNQLDNVLYPCTPCHFFTTLMHIFQYDMHVMFDAVRCGLTLFVMYEYMYIHVHIYMVTWGPLLIWSPPLIWQLLFFVKLFYWRWKIRCW